MRVAQNNPLKKCKNYHISRMKRVVEDPGDSILIPMGDPRPCVNIQRKSQRDSSLLLRHCYHQVRWS